MVASSLIKTAVRFSFQVIYEGELYNNNKHLAIFLKQIFLVRKTKYYHLNLVYYSKVLRSSTKVATCHVQCCVGTTAEITSMHIYSHVFDAKLVVFKTKLVR